MDEADKSWNAFCDKIIEVQIELQNIWMKTAALQIEVSLKVKEILEREKVK